MAIKYNFDVTPTLVYASNAGTSVHFKASWLGYTKNTFSVSLPEYALTRGWGVTQQGGSDFYINITPNDTTDPVSAQAQVTYDGTIYTTNFLPDGIKYIIPIDLRQYPSTDSTSTSVLKEWGSGENYNFDIISDRVVDISAAGGDITVDLSWLGYNSNTSYRVSDIQGMINDQLITITKKTTSFVASIPQNTSLAREIDFLVTYNGYQTGGVQVQYARRVTVKQAGAEVGMSVTPKSAVISSSAQTVDFNVTFKGVESATYNVNTGGLTYSKDGNTFSVVFPSNAATSTKTYNITVTSTIQDKEYTETVTVEQAGTDYGFTVYPLTKSIDYTEQTIYFSIEWEGYTPNTGYELTTTDSITFNKRTDGFYVKVPINESPLSRTLTTKVTYNGSDGTNYLYTVVITQGGSNNYNFFVTPSEFSMPYEGGDIRGVVTFTGYEATDNYLVIVPDGFTLKSKTKSDFVVTVPSNETGASRLSNIEIKFTDTNGYLFTDNIVITQDWYKNFTTSPLQKYVSKNGGIVTGYVEFVGYKPNTGYNVVVPDGWSLRTKTTTEYTIGIPQNYTNKPIQKVVNINYTDSDGKYYSYDANYYQYAGEYNFTIYPTDQTVDAESTSVGIWVNFTGYEASTLYDVIVPEGFYVTNKTKTMFTLNYPKNETNDAIVNTIRVTYANSSINEYTYDHTFTLTQEAGNYSFSINPTSHTVPYGGGNVSTDVIFTGYTPTSDYLVSIPSNYSLVSKTSSGFVIQVPNNNTTEEVVQNINVRYTDKNGLTFDKTLIVTTEAKPEDPDPTDYGFEVDPKTLFFDSEGETRRVTVTFIGYTPTTNYTVTATSGITIGNKSVSGFSATMAPNTSNAFRSGTITVKATLTGAETVTYTETINVVQEFAADIYPIWKDVIIYSDASSLLYNIIDETGVIYVGKAVGVDGVRIPINRIVQNFLPQNVFPMESGSFDYTKTVIYKSEYDPDRTFEFANDWSYKDHNRCLLSEPIIGYIFNNQDFVASYMNECSLYINDQFIKKYDEKYGNIRYHIDTLDCSVLRLVDENGYEAQYKIINPRDNKYTLYYVNKMGGWDQLPIIGNVTQNDSVVRYSYKQKNFFENATYYPVGMKNYITEYTPRWTLNTGYLFGQKDISNLLESNNVILYDGDRYIPVNIEDTNVVYKTYRNSGNKIYNYVITVSQSESQINR